MAETCNFWNTYNISNEYVAEAWLYNDYDRFNLLVITPCVVIFGILTNLIFLYTILRLKRMQTVTNYYLSALATCDVILLASGPTLLVFAYLKTVGRAFQYSLLQNRFHCITVFSVTAISYYTSLGIVSLVSSERFYALCSPLLHKAIAGKGRTVKLIIGALMFGVAFTATNVPSYAVWSYFCVIWPGTERFASMPTIGTRCGPISLKYYIYQELFTIVLFLTAFLYNSILYVRIVSVLSGRSIVKESNTTTQAQQVRNQVARVLVLNGLAFFVCQGPYRITAINRVTSAIFKWSFLSRAQAEDIDTVGRIMLYLNSAINPTLYALSSRFYRQAFMEAVGLGQCRCSTTPIKANESDGPTKSSTVSAVSSANTNETSVRIQRE